MQILKKHKNLFLAIGFLVCLLILHSSNAFDSDEGIILDGAWNMLHHRELYVDFFHFIPPASFFFIFLVWKIFGVSYLSAKIATIFVLFLGGIGIYKISRLFIKNIWVYLPALIYISTSFIWPIINHNLYNVVALIWASYFLLKALDNKKYNYFLLVGLLSGLSILFTQSRGGIFFVGVSLLLIFWSYARQVDFKHRFKISFILSAIFLPGLVLLFWPFDLILDYLILIPSTNYLDINIVDLKWLISFVVLYLGLCFAVREKGNYQKTALLFIQFLLILSSLSRPDFYHIAIIAWPAWIFLSEFFSQPRKIFWQKIYAIYAVLFLTFMIFYSLSGFNRASLFSINKSFDFVDYVKANCPGDYLYAGPFIPSMYFATDKLNPGPYYALFTGFNTPEQFEKQAEAIIDKQPTCAVLHYGIVAKFNYDIDNPVDRYILENYEMVSSFGDGMIYKLK